HFSGDDGSGGNFDKARNVRLSWLTDPKIRQVYLGNPDPLSFYGLPTSQPERSGPFVAQRFQRGVLQLWVDDLPGMPRPGAVVGVLAGDLAKEGGLLAAQALKPEYSDLDAELDQLVLPIPAFRQERSLSCEPSAASMAANYFGVPLTESQIVAELPRDPNPHKGFRGNINGWFGGIDDYGVYAEPIAQVLAKHGLNAEVVYGISLKALREAVSHNKVVIAWITYETAVRSPVVRDINGDKVVLVPWEHTVVVDGYDAQGVIVNDPATGGSDYYQNEDFARASGYFDGMAVLVSR
ncbi:MAG: C39 family peptidase, partial [Dehalococcoidia bacterium]|nr:C39 family peptidase [Dehalococcoidia bacterium]